MNRRFQWCLALTFVECAVAFTIALTQWVNLMPMWMATHDVEAPSLFTRQMITGYGFWGSAWGLPTWVVWKSQDLETRKRFARVSAGLYAAWWVFWWGQMWNHTWHAWVLAVYLPVRAVQLATHLEYGWRSTPRTQSSFAVVGSATSPAAS